MKRLQGSIWQSCDARVIPVNYAPNNQPGEVIHENTEAMTLSWPWPSFPRQVLLHQQKHGPRVECFVPYQAVAFPIRYDPRASRVSAALVEKSAMELAELAEEKGWQSVLLPLGDLTGDDLSIEKEIIAILQTWLPSSIFTLVERTAVVETAS